MGHVEDDRCKQGHPWTDANTQWKRPEGRNPYRACRICARVARQAHRERERVTQRAAVLEEKHLTPSKNTINALNRKVEAYAKRDLSYQKDAACAGMETEIFYAPDTEDYPPGPELREEVKRRRTLALATCGGCPVRDACLRSNLAEEYGIFGGKDEKQRASLLRESVAAGDLPPGVTDDPNYIDEVAVDKRGHIRRKSKFSKPQYGAEEADLVVAAYAQGLGIKRISKATGVHVSSVRRILIAKGVYKN
jgi:hypothetical protein